MHAGTQGRGAPRRVLIRRIRAIRIRICTRNTRPPAAQQPRARSSSSSASHPRRAAPLNATMNTKWNAYENESELEWNTKSNYF